MCLLKSYSILIFVASVVAQSPIITTKNGKIEGTAGRTSRSNKPYYAFVGIPFAQPPLGSLRFMPPQPVKNWNGILNGKTSNKMCYMATLNDPNESEDCLYLSIVTPSLNASAKLPVMIHIHGGGFTHGHGLSSSQPQFVTEKNIVVASISYRLGPFGFLSTGDSIVPGNMGLKDQHLAIKWIHDNIAVFGGDPTKVTLVGQSAGGASTTYQLMYPQNQGLFRAVIASSGSPLCYWAYQRHSLDSAYGIAQMIDSKVTKKMSTKELVKFLQGVSAKAIDNTGSKFQIWAPVMEISHSGAFFSKSMYQMVQSGQILKLPLLIGINSEEGLTSVTDLKTFKTSIAKYDKNPAGLVNEDMYISNKQTILDAAKDIKKIYTNSTWANNPGPAVKYMSDDHFARGVIKWAELQSIFSNVYFYQFSYHGQLGGRNITVPGIDHGVAHAEDQPYIWAHYSKSISKSDLLTVDRYVGLQTNFAKTLNPTPAKDALFSNIILPKVSKSNFWYLDIDAKVVLRKNPREFSYSKWEKIWELDARKPFISY